MLYRLSSRFLAFLLLMTVVTQLQVGHATTTTTATAIQQAIKALPSTGGKLDYTTVTGYLFVTQDMVVDRPVDLRFGCLQIVFQNGAAFRITSSFKISGSMKQCAGITAAAGTPILRASGSIRQLEVADLTLTGNGPGSQVICTPDYDGVNDFSQGNYRFHDLTVQYFGSQAFHFGVSTYSVLLSNIEFAHNHGSIFWDKYSELDMRDLSFWYPQPGPQVEGTYSSATVGDNLDFELGNAPSTDPDFQITAPSGTQGGFISLNHIKFGPEGENPARVKVRITSPSGGMVNRFRILDSNFACAVGQTAIEVDAPIAYNDFSHDWFNQCEVAVADNETVGATWENTSVFSDNTVLTAPGGNFTKFLHGGHGFGKIEQPIVVALQ